MSSESSTMKIEAKIVEKPAFTVVGMSVRTKPGDANMMQLWMDFDGQQERVRGRTELRRILRGNVQLRHGDQRVRLPGRR